MKSFIFLSILITSISTICVAQVNEDAFPDFSKPDDKQEEELKFDISRAIQLVNTAVVNLCEKDTAKTIELLSLFTDDYVNTGMDRLIGVKLGQLYAETNNLIAAEKAFMAVLSAGLIKNNLGVFSPKEIENCDVIIQPSNFTKAKTMACIGLYHLEMKQKDYKKAHQYLVLANSKYFPITSCGNGIEMYLVQNNKYFVDYFLTIGDTLGAINQYLDFIFKDRDYANSKGNAMKLKHLLLKKYTQKEINEEIEKGISGIYKKKIIVKGEEKESIYFSLFDHLIDDTNFYYRKTIEGDIRISLRQNETLLILKNEK